MAKSSAGTLSAWQSSVTLMMVKISRTELENTDEVSSIMAYLISTPWCERSLSEAFLKHIAVRSEVTLRSCQMPAEMRLHWAEVTNMSSLCGQQLRWNSYCEE